MRNTLFILALLALFTSSCTKDFEGKIITNFDYTTVSSYAQRGHLQDTLNVNFEVQPIHTVTSVNYYFKYEILKGEGHFIDYENNVLDTDIEVDLPKIELKKYLKFNYRFVPKSLGEIQAKVYLSDNFGRELVELIDYTTEHAEFNANVISLKNTIEVGTETNISLEVLNTDEDLNYTVSYRYGENSIGTGEVKLSNTNILANDPKEITAIEKKIYNFSSQEIGLKELIFTFKDSNGFSFEKTVLIDVVNSPFTVNVEAENLVLEQGQETAVYLNLEGFKSDVTYTLTETFGESSTSNKGVLKLNGSPVAFGKSNTIKNGTYAYTFSSEEVGTNEIIFSVSDEYGQIITDTVTINITNANFQFSGSSENQSVFVNQANTINFNLFDNLNTLSSYNIIYTQITGNGAIYGLSANTPQSVQKGNFSFEFTPLEKGRHTLEFTVTDRYGNSSEPVLINITAIDLDLDFKVTATAEVLTKEQSTVTVNLLEQGNYEGVTYELSYTSNNSDIVLYDAINNSPVNQSSYFKINTGTTNFYAVSNVEGNFELEFTLRDSNGQIITDNTRIAVIENKYSFNAVSTQTTELLGIGVPVYLRLNEFPVVNDTYTVYFESNENGYFDWNGQKITRGQSFEVQSGEMLFTFYGEEYKSYTIDFFVSANTSGAEDKTDDVQIEFKKEEFELNSFFDDSHIQKKQYDEIYYTIEIESLFDLKDEYTISYHFTDSEDHGYMRAGTGTRYEPEELIKIDEEQKQIRLALQVTDSEDFTIVFTVSNKSGEVRTTSHTHDIYKLPVAWGKIEPDSRDQGGIKGNEYNTKFVITEPFDNKYCEAFNGSNMNQIKLNWFDKNGNEHTRFFDFPDDFGRIDRGEQYGEFNDPKRYYYYTYLEAKWYEQKGSRIHHSSESDFFVTVIDSEGISSNEYNGTQN